MDRFAVAFTSIIPIIFAAGDASTAPSRAFITFLVVSFIIRPTPDRPSLLRFFRNSGSIPVVIDPVELAYEHFHYLLPCPTPAHASCTIPSTLSSSISSPGIF